LATEHPPLIARFFDEAALSANRAGGLAPAQRAQLRQTVMLRIVGYLVSGSLAFMLYMVRAEATGQVGLVLGIVLVAVLAMALLFFKILPPLADLRAGRAGSVEGTIRKESWVSSGGLSRRQQHQLLIGGQAFRVSGGLFNAVQEDARAIAYFLPRTGELLTLVLLPA
jgi:hypothetical protein